MFIPLHDANHLRHIRVQWVTLAIIVANCLVWFFFTSDFMASATTARVTYFSYGLIPAVASGARELPELYSVLPDYTRYVTYAFLHGDFMHLARTVARRAERLMVALSATETISDVAIRYINRVSDFLFVASRVVNSNGTGDVLWVPGKNRQG